MGVYIKYMEMPKRCSKCPFAQEWVCVINRSLKRKPENEVTTNYCQLIEVPPHGRLGDLDKLEKMFADIDSAPYSCFDGEEPFYSAEDASHIIKLAPTVIPAEEGEI